MGVQAPMKLYLGMHIVSVRLQASSLDSGTATFLQRLDSGPSASQVVVLAVISSRFSPLECKFCGITVERSFPRFDQDQRLDPGVHAHTGRRADTNRDVDS